MRTLTIIAAFAGLMATAAPASAAPLAATLGMTATPVTPIAEGCGPGRWRGPWGGCRGPGWGPGPGYAYGGPPAEGWNGCPPGYWRGPWGHCRDTPYHGRLPGGGWR
jgi:hypothetical protein